MSVTSYLPTAVKKAAAVLTLLSFTLTQIQQPALALPVPAHVPPVLSVSSTNPFPIQIPLKLGRVETSWYPENGQDVNLNAMALKSPDVILIQDAHGQISAQKNTRRLLAYLEKEMGIRALLLEGAAGEQNPQLLNFFQESWANKRAAQWLMEEGETGGAELYLLERAGVTRKAKQIKPVPAFGLEEPGLYLENLRQYQRVMKQRDTARRELSGHGMQIEKKASQIFNLNLYEFFKQIRAADIESLDLEHALNMLQSFARQDLKTDLKDPRAQQSWPMLTRYFALKERAPKVNQEAAKKEWQRLLNFAKEKRIHHTLLEKVSQDEQDSHLDRRGLWESFYAAAAPLGFKFIDYPALSLAEGARILEEELDFKLLQSEMDTLRATIFTTLAKTPEEKKILGEYAQFLNLEKLLDLKWTREDFRNHGVGELSAKTKGKAQNGVDSLAHEALKFYQQAEGREAEFVKQLESCLRELVQKESQRHGAVVLVAGGFHTEGITAHLREKKISYAVLTPHMAAIESEANYFRAMTGASANPAGLYPFFKREQIPESSSSATLRMAGLMTAWHNKLPKVIAIRRDALQDEILKAGSKSGVKLNVRSMLSSRSEVREISREDLSGWVDRVEKLMEQEKPEDELKTLREEIKNKLQSDEQSFFEEIWQKYANGMRYEHIPDEYRVWIDFFLILSAAVLSSLNPQLEDLRRLDRLVQKWNLKDSPRKWNFSLTLFMQLVTNGAATGDELRGMMRLAGNGIKLPGEYRYKMAAFALYLLGMHVRSSSLSSVGFDEISADFNPKRSLQLAAETLNDNVFPADVRAELYEELKLSLQVGLTHFLYESARAWAKPSNIDEKDRPKIKPLQKFIADHRELLAKTVREIQAKSKQTGFSYLGSGIPWIFRNILTPYNFKQNPPAVWDRILLDGFDPARQPFYYQFMAGDHNDLESGDPEHYRQILEGEKQQHTYSERADRIYTNLARIIETFQPENRSEVRMDLNQASEEELMRLFAEMAPDRKKRNSLVQRIIKGRPYDSLEDLRRIQGIGDGRMRQIQQTLGSQIQIQPLSDFQKYLISEELYAYPNLRQLFEASDPEIERVKEALLEDRVLRPVFMVKLPDSAVESFKILKPELLEKMGGLELLREHSVFLAGSPAIADQMAAQGYLVRVGVTDRWSRDDLYRTYGWKGDMFAVAGGRQTYFPLADGTWLGVKGGGQNIDPEKPPAYLDKAQVFHRYHRGLAVIGEAQNLEAAQPLLETSGTRFVQPLGYQRIKQVPDGKGGWVSTDTLRWSDGKPLEPVLIFNRVVSPHRWIKLPQLLKADPGLEKLRQRITPALIQLGYVKAADYPEGHSVPFSDLLRMLAKQIGINFALAQNQGFYKATINAQDYTFGAEETDAEDFYTIEGLSKLIRKDAGFYKFSGILLNYGIPGDPLLSAQGVLDYILLEIQGKFPPESIPGKQELKDSMFAAYFEILNEQNRDKWSAFLNLSEGDPFLKTLASVAGLSVEQFKVKLHVWGIPEQPHDSSLLINQKKIEEISKRWNDGVSIVLMNLEALYGFFTMDDRRIAQELLSIDSYTHESLRSLQVYGMPIFQSLSSAGLDFAVQELNILYRQRLAELPAFENLPLDSMSDEVSSPTDQSVKARSEMRSERLLDDQWLKLKLLSELGILSGKLVSFIYKALDAEELNTAKNHPEDPHYDNIGILQMDDRNASLSSREFDKLFFVALDEKSASSKEVMDRLLAGLYSEEDLSKAFFNTVIVLSPGMHEQFPVSIEKNKIQYILAPEAIFNEVASIFRDQPHTQVVSVKSTQWNWDIVGNPRYVFEGPDYKGALNEFLKEKQSMAVHLVRLGAISHGKAETLKELFSKSREKEGGAFRRVLAAGLKEVLKKEAWRLSENEKEALAIRMKELEDASRSEMRGQSSEALIQVAVQMTAGIVRVRDAVEIYQQLYGDQKPVKRISLSGEEKQNLLWIYTRLFNEGRAAMLPSSILLGMSNEGAVEYLDLLIQAYRQSGAKLDRPLVHLAGDVEGKAADLLKQVADHEAAGRIFKVWTAGEETVVDQLAWRDSHVAAALTQFHETRAISLLVNAEEIRRLSEPAKVQFASRLTQLLLAAAALSQREFEQLARDLGMQVQQGKAIQVNTEAVLSGLFMDRMRERLSAVSA